MPDDPNAKPERPSSELFAPERERETRDWKPMAVAAFGVIVVIAALVVLFSHGNQPVASGNPNEPTALAAYAANLPITDVKMSTANNMAGANLYYVQGKIANTGKQTINGATIELVFRNTQGQIVDRQDMPLTVITSTEPYVDTAQLSRAPLAPGQSRDFQLTLEHISDQWNQQYPEVRVIRTQG